VGQNQKPKFEYAVLPKTPHDPAPRRVAAPNTQINLRSCAISNFERGPNGIGKKLMIHAMETTVQVAELVGIYALILQAVDAEIGRRYQKWGFEYFLGEQEKPQPNMFIALETIKEARPKSGIEAAS
jgi:hypothetical protein